VPRLATFGPAAAAPVAGWAYLGEPVFLAGLALMAVASLLVIPALAVTVACFLPELPKRAVPRSWRASYRSRRGPRQGQRSARIPARLRQLIHAADRHRCVGCGSRRDLQVDHGIPWAWGGLTILSNSFTLCRDCNIIKLDYWESWGGVPHYSRHFAVAHRNEAHRIFRRERWHRLSPLRMLRLAWALGR
jgi:5-methylcytosine-specific restriction endonuclease McrA